MIKKLGIIIITVLVLIVVIGGVYLYLQKSKLDKTCNGNNLNYCDKSCNSDQDCAKGGDCFCYNKNNANKVNFDQNGKAILWELCGPAFPNCGCINNICTNTK
jgi:hypothetical protein